MTSVDLGGCHNREGFVALSYSAGPGYTLRFRQGQVSLCGQRDADVAGTPAFPPELQGSIIKCVLF